MLNNNSYQYNANLKRIVAVFGTLFNDISISKKVNGKATGIQRVPISYGPKQKFLARLASDQSDEYGDIAIKLPRMSFEITSLSYDSTSKLNRLNTKLYPVIPEDTISSQSKIKVYQSVPYRMGMQLNILAHYQDDACQVLEQVLPYFTPEYTVAIKDLEGPGSITDVPFTLISTNIQDDYEGDFANSRRTIVYSLDFEIKFKFIGLNTGKSKVIHYVEVDLFDINNPNTAPVPGVDPRDPSLGRISVQLGDPENDTPEEYTVITTYGFDGPESDPA